MTYTAWSVVFGEQPSASKWNQLGTNDAHFYSFLGDNLPWQVWTPSFTQITKGNGTLTGRSTQVGKTILASATFQSGSTTSFGASTYQISLPFNFYTTPGTVQTVGNWTCYDSVGTIVYGNGVLQLASTSSAYMLASFAPAALNGLNKLTGAASANFSPPITGSGSYWQFNFQYETA